ncbi:MAG: hypothetical protein COS14_10815 [Bacteroidetes bacterium CG02_land_8_20_14_3_00_31_25]|nr:MAG: hypothetical protein COS14_10815 [Bacteroidetes bacterium CG02_land_8_20_14_3_00_31_25]PIX34803.1 MAG: hypothetical protein COZ59_07355 [Bacteroidetes bacterium CG_4_8_14_3_um_filter_31_14]PIY04837.1 MAG: hypothetical protein COZ21_05510 [Bacteroidetes bacterium CG_4_10_14_3_um_filter_31_20]
MNLPTLKPSRCLNFYPTAHQIFSLPTRFLHICLFPTSSLTNKKGKRAKIPPHNNFVDTNVNNYFQNILVVK